MNILKNLDTSSQWIGSISGDIFKTKEKIPYSLDILDKYEIDGSPIKIVRQITQTKGITNIQFERILEDS